MSKKQLVTIWMLLLTVAMTGQDISESLIKYSSSHHLEKVYISFDKPAYSQGDTIWGKVYYRDARTHLKFDASPIVHIECYDENGAQVKSWMTKVNDGSASFDFVADSTIDGNYTFRAYTQYQRNFGIEYMFSKILTVHSLESLSKADEVTDNDSSSKVNLAFYPEGGRLVNGLKCKVAFEAWKNDRPFEYSGQLMNSKGKAISPVQVLENGRGVFEFTPESGQQYYLSSNEDSAISNFELPQAQDQGYTLAVVSRSKETLSIVVSSNTDDGLKNITLLGHIRGEPFLEEQLTDQNEIRIKLNRSEIPSGVLHLTLFDDSMRPVAERLAFNKNPEDNIDVLVEQSKSVFQKREKMDAKLSISGMNSEAISDATITVYNTDMFSPGEDMNIMSYFLLQSDIGLAHPTIVDYFKENSAKTNVLLDLIMMTQGWRRFIWKDVINEKTPQFEFATEESIKIVGVVRNKKKKEIKSDVFMNIFSDESFANMDFTTDKNGVFYFTDLNFEDTTNIIIQASEYNAKKKKKLKAGESKRVGNKNVNIELVSLEDLPFEQETNTAAPIQLVDKEVFEEVVTQIEYNNEKYDIDWNIDLDEVTVKGMRKTEQEKKIDKLKDVIKSRGMFYFPSSQKLFMDDLPGEGLQYQDIYQILRGRVPGLQVRGTGLERFFVIRNTSNMQGYVKATILLDGFELSDLGASSIRPENILAVDVIKGLSASSVFGAAGAGGVISIITREPGDTPDAIKKKKVEGTINIQHPGYYRSREFYSPNYAVRNIDHQRPDLRTTVYWNPKLKLSSDPTDLEFYTGDLPGSYIIRIEGITDTGIPFVGESAFTVVE